MRKGDWIQTYTGKKFYPLDPREEEIDIEDIAHSLSMICRFSGHCQQFYSVAEHSVHVESLLSETHKGYGLLHDASEAYISDIARPVKPYLNNYKNIESLIGSVIYSKFGLSVLEPEELKIADLSMLACEASQIMKHGGKDWYLPVESANITLLCLPPKEAKELFMKKALEIGLI